MAQLLYFGRLQDTTGCASAEFQFPSSVSTTNDLRDFLDKKFSSNGALLDASVRIAINGELVVDPAPVSNSDEIAFMPPVGGG